MKELQKAKLSKRVCVGVVTSDKMDKTVVVSISTKKLHRIYQLYI
ncbi:30S ribosomal protein S17 [Treponema endosymbiont of Eucomonympha sp.]|nr:30S ribosomal protein S17 [Treponema endosymbiont of Eucomonympha sp.]